MTRAVRIGVAVALAYVAVVAATQLRTNHNVRPLFDAVGPPPPYRWVNPPPDFEAGNVKPKPADVAFGVQPQDPPIGGSSEDSQFVFNIPKGAIAPHGDAKVVAHIVPFDPDRLGPLPARTFADGNAYRITLAYQPGGDAATVSTNGSILLTVPVPADGVVFSSDGQTWRALKSQHLGATSIGADLPATGYYLATMPEALRAGSHKGAARFVVPIVITAVIAAALVATPVVLRRRNAQRRRRSRTRRRR